MFISSVSKGNFYSHIKNSRLVGTVRRIIESLWLLSLYSGKRKVNDWWVLSYFIKQESKFHTKMSTEFSEIFILLQLSQLQLQNAWKIESHSAKHLYRGTWIRHFLDVKMFRQNLPTEVFYFSQSRIRSSYLTLSKIFF